jgi:hypothetical protein
MMSAGTELTLTPCLRAPSVEQLYGLVARGKEVLSEYTAVSGNFPTITRLLLVSHALLVGLLTRLAL